MRKTCESLINCDQDKHVVIEKKGFSIIECNQCGHRFLPIKDVENHLAQVYSDDYFFEGKEGYPNYLDQKDILYKYGKRYARIVSKYRTPGSVLDIGCAAGFILKGFKDAGWDCHGVEPNDTMASYGRGELKMDVKTGGLETYESRGKFDLVSMIQVIGHFYDLDQAFTNVTRLLKDDGMVLVESWNMKSSAAKILGHRWHEYSPPSVVHWFSDDTLKELFRFYGFELVAKGLPAKRINTKHAISFFEGKLPRFGLKTNLMGFLKKTIGRINLIYPPIDVKWYIFKKVQDSA